MKVGKVISFMALPLALSYAAVAYAAYGLDDFHLRENLAERVLSSITEEGQALDISADKIQVLQVEPVTIGETTLYAVKLAIVEPDGRLNDMVLITDSTGDYQFTNIREIKNGEEAALSQVPSITKMSLPDGLAKTIAKGNGIHDVVFISDPFCPFCRKAFAYLINQVDDIKEFKAVHYPLPMHPGAEAASWVMSEAEEMNLTPLRVMRFAYTQLILPAQKDAKVELDSLQKNIVAQFVKAFPSLLNGEKEEDFFNRIKKKWAAQINDDVATLSNMDITATPAILIDGQMVRGFDTQRIERLLGKK